MLDRFLHHPSRYRYKVEFVEFCVMKVLFSGRDEDLVLREDFIEAFRRHSGVSFSCNKSFVQHLVAAGVRVTRVIRRRVKKYYYVGMRLVDGEGRRFADFMSGGRHGDVTQDSDGDTKVGIQRTTPQNSRLTALDPFTTYSPLPAANTSEGRQRTTPKNGPPIPFDPSIISSTPKKADISEGRPTNTAMEKLMKYKTLHKDRQAFIRFCRDKIRFTGDLSDFIFRKDLFEEFRKFLGGEKPSQTTVGRHLVSAGVMVTRVGSGVKREYGYRGMCFVDGRGCKAAKVGAVRTRRSQGGRTQTQKQQIRKSQGGRTQTQKKQQIEKSRGGRTQAKKKPQTGSPVQGLQGASHDKPRDQTSTSTLNSPLHPPPSASVPSPPLSLSPIHGPSYATFPPTASSPTLSQAFYSAPLDLSTSSSAPLDLSTSAPSQTPYNKHHAVFNTSDVPNTHLPFTSSFSGYPNHSHLPPVTSSLPPPPLTHANPQTPTLTPLQAHVNLPQPAPSPFPTYSPWGTIRLLECVLAYLTSPKMQEELKTFYYSNSTAEEGEEGEEMESN